MPRPVCILMVKTPRAGTVKTRLAPPLSGAQAAALAACFARDTLACVRRVAPETIVAYTPSDGRAELEALFACDELLWFEQQGVELGARLASVVEHAAALGYSPIIVVGTDSPTLPSLSVEMAVSSLSAGESDLALGPTEDGGYYLVGLRQPSPDIFRDVAWSTPQVFSQTAANAAREGLRLLTLPRWYDVDTPEDLLRLRDELATDEAARARALHTYRWLLAHAASIRAST